MPSPFPGMNPYLENPAWWPSIHQGLITFLWTGIGSKLPKRYRAQMGERVYVVDPRLDLVPDLHLTRKFVEPSLSVSGGVAVAADAAADPSILLNLEPIEVREVYLEILDAETEDRVVTVLEVLSPSNKKRGHPGRERYFSKQHSLRKSNTNLVEIDLLRRGAATVLAPVPASGRRSRWNYVVSLRRGGQGDEVRVWPRSVRQPLPRFAVPLSPGDQDVLMDLQPLLNRLYDEGQFEGRINYQNDPPPPRFDRADADWLDALLREKGLRT